ncbi:winged helix-turn-helix transcriptional regulator [Paenibacillus lycopersici]|uniref:Winged helix-turn-helix transcriptional regulator n=1 Tax=Paenibacillus lycopersici TaxID=2704462 RepID=A0A6C0FNX0_9BACL|nr:MarR family winged helix-turn-helix transcriptional regulator [Paenibacillus lycopersici]QHT58587.1 winged helix-turn-helix transcriptional regulator [Paenibacillus lycopersici]
MIKGTNSISEQIHLLHILQKHYIHKQLSKIELNEIQARTLNYVLTYPGVIQRDLAQYLGKQNATITNILKILEKRKYIKREITAGNERQKELYITEDGKRQAEFIQHIFSDLEDIISGALHDLEKSNVKDGLKKISDHLKRHT